MRSLGRILRRAHRAGKHDVVGYDFDLDVRIRQETAEVCLEAGNIALNLHVERDDFLAARTEDEDIRLTDGLAKKIDPPRGAGDGIGH
ncbi:hypothetical protein D3C87_1746470 [compost metagenome]